MSNNIVDFNFVRSFVADFFLPGRNLGFIALIVLTVAFHEYEYVPMPMIVSAYLIGKCVVYKVIMSIYRSILSV